MPNPTFRVSSGLIDPKHMRRMGGALKVFLWCVNRQTDPSGLVLHGRPVRAPEIGESVGCNRHTVYRYLTRLRGQGYIAIVRKAAGLVLRVLNQKKWEASDGRKAITHSPEGWSKNDHSDGRKLDHPILLPLLKLTPEEDQQQLGAQGRDGSRALPVEIRHNGGRPFSLVRPSRPCSRCGGLGARGDPWLCPACTDFYRGLLREAGQGCPEVLR